MSAIQITPTKRPSSPSPFYSTSCPVSVTSVSSKHSLKHFRLWSQETIGIDYSDLQVDFCKKYQLLEQLGIGATCGVYLAERLVDGMHFAVKLIKKVIFIVLFSFLIIEIMLITATTTISHR